MRKGIAMPMLALVAAAVVAALPADARAAPPAAHVAGGGTAVFDDERFGGLTTQIGFGVAVEADGSATGNFTCVITGVLTLVLMAEEGTLNDDGGVYFAGPAFVYFTSGDMVVFDGFVTVWAGGPGVGGFGLGPPTFPDTEADFETVVKGMITIKTN